MAAASPIIPSLHPVDPIGPVSASTPRVMTVTLQPSTLSMSSPVDDESSVDIGTVDISTINPNSPGVMDVTDSKIGALGGVRENGPEPVLDEELGNLSDNDGRLTPLASESSRPSRSESTDPLPSSPQSSSVPPTTHSSVASLPSTQPAQGSYNALPVTPAEIGLSTLGTEKQLRDAAAGKDRLLILLIAREIEAFIGRVVNQEQSIFVPPSGATMLSVFNMASPIATTMTSKFQRMLVYKAAEWYGLRGISGPEGIIYIGLIGSMDEKTPTLHLADLAPKPPTPKQSFKIMQRVPVGSSGSASSRAASAAGDSEASGSRFKTMEEREANYALARERIFKDSETIASPDSATAPASTPDEMEQRGRTLRGQPRTDEDDDFVPRRVASSLQPVYASLYHPQPDPTPPLSAYQQRQPSGQDVPGQQVYQHPDNGYNYQSNVQDMYAFGVQNGGFTSTPTQNGYTQQGHPMYTAPNQPYIDHNHQYNNANGYPPQPWQQFSPPSQPGSDSPNGTSMYAPAPPMVPGYGYPPGQMGLPGQMPMIPQGAQAFPPQYAYPQQGSPYHQLAQPTPTRPGFPPHQHSSTSSSISSRSYQDYSRPHSRGSTTSTRSATSSVRLGAMYPAQTGGSGARYRQQGMKSQPVGTSLFASSSDGQAARGHSPSSNTTTSSRSSKRKASINLQPPAPGQHQLPTRPDWAANNVSYHPMPLMPSQAQMQAVPGQFMPSYTVPGHMMPMQMMATNQSDFPPLLRNGSIAEPMQVERAKMMPRGNVWNGTGSRGVRSPPNTLGSSAGGPPQHVAAQTTRVTEDLGRVDTPSPQDADPDFPRRNTGAKAPGALYDPKQPTASTISRPESSASVRTGASVVPPVLDGEADNAISRSAVDVIEAKLAALSVTAGIDIGPPPKGSPSYAKVLRRE